MTDPAEETLILPELDQGMLDAAGLGALLRDIDVCTDVIEVMLKGAPRDRASDARVTVPDAHVALVSRACRGVQVRYRYHGDEWWDTVLATPEGFKVVRIRQDWGQR